MSDGVGVNVVGMEVGPMRVERVLSVHAGLGGSARLERAVLPMSMR